MRTWISQTLLLIFQFSLHKCERNGGIQLITKAEKIDSQTSTNIEELQVIQVSTVVRCVSACAINADCQAIIFSSSTSNMLSERPCKLMKTSLTSSYLFNKEETGYLLDRNPTKRQTTTAEVTTTTTIQSQQSTTTTNMPATTEAKRTVIKEEFIKRHHGADIFDDKYMLFYDHPAIGLVYIVQKDNPDSVLYQKNKPDIFPTFQGQPNAAFNFNGKLYLQNISTGTEGVWKTFVLTKINDQIGTANETPDGITHPQISGQAVYATRIGTDSVIMKYTDGSIKCYHVDDILCKNCTKTSQLKSPSEKCLEIARNLGSDPRYAEARSLIGHYYDYLAYTTFDVSTSSMTVHNYED